MVKSKEQHKDVDMFGDCPRESYSGLAVDKITQGESESFKMFSREEPELSD